MRFYKEIKEGFGRGEDHRGLGQELAHEKNNIAININGRTWKVIPGRGYADSKEEWAYLNNMKSWAEKKSQATGKTWTVSLTGAEVSENKTQAEPALLENEDDTPMYGAIIHRIMVAHPDLLSKYGPEKIMMAAQEEAEWVGDVEEIGSSDVSISVKRVMQALQEQNPTESIVEEIDDEGAMAKSQLTNLAKKAQALAMQMTPDKQLDAWVQSLITRAETDITDVHDFLGNSTQSVDEAEETNPEDVICVDVPLFIRLLEYAREDAKTDMDLHDVAENARRLSADGATLSMSNYESIIPSKDVEAPAEEPVTEATGHAGYDNMLKVMQAVDRGEDATFDLAGEPITLEYPEARFLAGKYKAFLRAGRQEEFLKYMNDPVMFDRLMLQLRQLIDKQKNFKGSVPGERGVEEAAKSPYAIGMAAAKKKYGYGDKPAHDLPKKVIKKAHEIGDKIKADESLNADEYYCNVDRCAKPIPEGYKKLASGYITRK